MECLKRWESSPFGCQIGLILKKLERVCSRRETPSTSMHEIWLINEDTIEKSRSVVITIYYCYRWKDPNTEEKWWLKKQLVRWNLRNHVTELGDEIPF